MPAAESEGETPLYVAALYGKVDILPLLLAAGADANLANNSGEELGRF